MKSKDSLSVFEWIHISFCLSVKCLAIRAKTQNLSVFEWIYISFCLSMKCLSIRAKTQNLSVFEWIHISFCLSMKCLSIRAKTQSLSLFEWIHISFRGLLFQWANSIKIKLGKLVLYKTDIIIVSSKSKFFTPWE